MESLCEGDTDPAVLDILDIHFEKPLPHHHQTENHLIDATRSWVKRGCIEGNDVRHLCQHPTALWINTDHTVHGCFDCISREEAKVYTKSIVLICPQAVNIEVRVRTRDGAKRIVPRVKFSYNDVVYNFSLTDPVALGVYGRKPYGDYSLAGAHLCISLTEPYAKDNNRCHKVVASILTNRFSEWCPCQNSSTPSGTPTTT